jgi:hypothetical protein
MSLRAEDIPRIKQLEDVLMAELDRQSMDNEFDDSYPGYFDPVSGLIEGKPDWFKAITAVMTAYWDEEGR